MAQALQRREAPQLVGQNAAPLICGAGGMTLKLNSPSREWFGFRGKVTPTNIRPVWIKKIRRPHLIHQVDLARGAVVVGYCACQVISRPTTLGCR